MKCHWPILLCAVSMLGCITMGARAQAQEADAHVAAAKAALSTENPKPWQTFDSLFRTVCTPRRKDHRDANRIHLGADHVGRDHSAAYRMCGGSARLGDRRNTTLG